MHFRVHHVAVSVRDMPESIVFYGLFGFKVALHHKEPDGSLEIAHLKLGDMFLELWWYQNHTPAPASAGDLTTDLPRVGVKHLAIQVESIDEAKRLVEGHGLATNVLVQDGRTGVRYFFINDPSGALLEFVEDNRRL